MEHLTQVLGQPIDDLRVQQVLAPYALVDITADDEEDPAVWFKNGRRGILVGCRGDDERIHVIFLSSDVDDGGAPLRGPLIAGLTFQSKRRHARRALGKPTQRSQPPWLWDRWDFSGYKLHLEYNAKSKVIEQITLMAPDE